VGLDWIDMAQDRDQWRALLNTLGNVWVAEGLLASQGGVSFSKS
jgi:hypothetical protein